MNIVCFGDSITHAAGFAEKDRWPTVLQNTLETWRPGMYAVYNRGIGGNTTAQGYDRFEADILPLLPGLLLLEFGFNDANVRDWAQKPRVGLQEFVANIQEFCRIATRHGGRPVLLINHSIDRPGIQANGRSYQDNFQPYNDALKDLADSQGLCTIDLPALMKERHIELAEFLSEDGLHLSVKGNHLYAQMVADGLKTLPEATN